MDLEKMNAETERMKFHWEVWKSESQSFWNKITVISVAMLLLILFQIGAVKLNLSWFSFEIPDENKLWFQRFFSIPVYFILLIMAFFSFVDLMRNRIPDTTENKIHNNIINFGPFKKKINLLILGRVLYLLVFIIYFLMTSLGFFFLIKQAFY